MAERGRGPQGRPDMATPGPDLMRVVIEDKLAFVEKAMQAILQAKQEAMDAKVAVVEMEAKMRALQEHAALKMEAFKNESSLKAKLQQQETKLSAERAIEQARREAESATAEVRALRERLGQLEEVKRHAKELEEVNRALRDELDQWRRNGERLEAMNRELRQQVETLRVHQAEVHHHEEDHVHE
jgi:hypothetical protein